LSNSLSKLEILRDFGHCSNGHKIFFSILFAKLYVFGAKIFSAGTIFEKKTFFLKIDEKLHKMTEILFLISIF